MITPGADRQAQDHRGFRLDHDASPRRDQEAAGRGSAPDGAVCIIYDLLKTITSLKLKQLASDLNLNCFDLAMLECLKHALFM